MGSFPETKIIDPNFLPRETSAVQKFCTDDVNLSRIWSGALIGQCSSYIVLAIVYE